MEKKKTTNRLIYTGEKLKEKPIDIPYEKNGEKYVDTIYPYLPAMGLVKAVNLSILLQRPLLIMGPPGCGKTILAKSVAYELHGKDFHQYFFEWNITSMAKAKDGLYHYDVIERLRDAKAGGQLKSNIGYRHLGKLGEAIELSMKKQKRAVVLIDEVDKADLDFPNDLLNEIDKAAFYIPETEEHFIASKGFKPIIIITSNQEKDLPNAFLRRCLYYYIDFPKDTDLMRILNSRFYKNKANKAHQDLIEKAVYHFINIREDLEDMISTVTKSISTSELIDWFTALKFYSEQKGAEATDEEDVSLAALIEELDKLNADNRFQNIPYAPILLKNWNSLIAYERANKEQSA